MRLYDFLCSLQPGNVGKKVLKATRKVNGDIILAGGYRGGSQGTHIFLFVDENSHWIV